MNRQWVFLPLTWVLTLCRAHVAQDSAFPLTVDVGLQSCPKVFPEIVALPPSSGCVLLRAVTGNLILTLSMGGQGRGQQHLEGFFSNPTSASRRLVSVAMAWTAATQGLPTPEITIAPGQAHDD